MGTRLTRELLDRGHAVRALARAGSESKVERGAEAVCGDALNASTFAAGLRGCDAIVHLTGTAHPAPWKERQFRAIDQASLRATLAAAGQAGVNRLVYVSVAHPAPTMRAYIAVRMECEAAIAEAGLNANILRPWYVLGPGHRWPTLLKPLYRFFEKRTSTRDSAFRLGLVTIDEMVAALVWAVENPADGIRVIDVPRIRELGKRASALLPVG